MTPDPRDAFAPLSEEGAVSVRKGAIAIRQNAIPDSAIHHWPTNEGSGSTLSDDVSTLDGSINGATWVSGNWVGDWVLDYDGVDDSTSFGSQISEITKSGTFSVALTVEPDDVSNRGQVVTHSHGGSDRFGVTIEGDSLRVGVFDGSTWTSASGPISTNSKTRVFAIYDGSMALYLNNSEATGTDNPVGNDVEEFAFGSSGGGNHYNGRVDDPIVMDSAEGGSTINDDYNRQPWT